MGCDDRRLGHVRARRADHLRFTDNQKLKKVADLFGARIAASGQALPNSDPVALKGGDVKVD